jgi:hypothetical protein
MFHKCGIGVAESAYSSKDVVAWSLSGHATLALVIFGQFVRSTSVDSF